MADTVHIQAPGGDIGGHQNIQFALLQFVDGALALGLGDIAIQRRGGKTPRRQLLGQIGGHQAGAHKHDHGIEGLGLQNAGQGIQLVGATHRPVTLADQFGGGLLGLDGDLLRLVQMAIGNAPHFRRHGGGEQGNLPGRRGLLQDPFHIINKAHTQHLIGLIQHQSLEAVQLQGATAHMVHHPPGSAHHHMGTTLKAAHLTAVVLTAINRQHMKALEIGRIGLKGLGHLNGQLPGGRQHQHLRVFLGEIQAGQGWQGKGGGLASAGLGLTQHIAARQQ